MKISINSQRLISAALLPVVYMLASCSKLVSISDPLDRITNGTVFSTDDFANGAVNGIYNTMLADNSFGKGMTALYGALSADEINLYQTYYNQYYPVNTNHLILIGSGANRTCITDNLWTSAYGAIYNANAVLEGLNSSTSAGLHETARQQFTAEAKFLRAFCYFHLVNFFGDVPLALTTEYSATATLPRSSVKDVYQQIIKDLEDARDNLAATYPGGGNNRTRVNKWAAATLLARVYLFTGDYSNALTEASNVINQSALYVLEPDLDKVFPIASREAIWQLNQKTTSQSTDATPEGLTFLPVFTPNHDTILVNYLLSPQLVNAFEAGDKRKQQWIDLKPVYQTSITAYYSRKYKTGAYNQVLGGTPVEYSVVLRLAELYLIRAEAQAHGVGGGSAAAIADLNIIRNRAGLPGLPGSLSGAALLDAVAHEWQTEFFCEWGHRWFNLKRTGKAHSVLSQIPIKQPWAGDQQLLYPVPPGDISLNKNLIQNPGY